MKRIGIFPENGYIFILTLNKYLHDELFSRSVPAYES
jgi:hypothetical protein